MISILQQNRDKIGQSLVENSALVLFSGKSLRSTADAQHAFVVNRNFYYMTGIDRENFVFVMQKCQGKLSTYLFIEKSNYDIEKWNGRKMKPEIAKQISGINNIKFVEAFDSFINAAVHRDINTIYTDINRLDWHDEDAYQYQWLKTFKAKCLHVNIENAFHILANARMIKSDYEIEQIEKAIAYTKTGLEALMKDLSPDKYEYQLNSVFTHSITYNGSEGNSFPTIAASGDNGVILHYVENENKLVDGNLVLMDLGALENKYASDISRTYPISGKYTARQKQLYNIVLGAMDAVIDIMRPGTPFAKLNETCKDYLAKELKAIGLIETDEELQKYYYHGVSHHLGLDVHDIADRSRALEAGMVLTVEPGLYIAEEGIGIRIEDDILITKDGNKNLSESIIKKVEDIEQFMANKA